MANLAEKTITDAQTLATDAKQLAEGVLAEKSGSSLSVASSVVSDAGSDFSTKGKRHRGKKERPHEEQEAALFAKLSAISMNENASNARGSNHRRRGNKKSEEQDSRSSSQMSNDWHEEAGSYVDSTHSRGVQDNQQRGSVGGPGKRGGPGAGGGQSSSRGGRDSQTLKFYRQLKRPQSRDFNESHGADGDDEDESQEDKKEDEGGEKAKEIHKRAGSLETGKGSTSSAHRTSRQGASKLSDGAERSSSSLPESKLFATTERNSDHTPSKQERKWSDDRDERRNYEKKEKTSEFQQFTDGERGNDKLAEIKNRVDTLVTGSKQQTLDYDDEASMYAVRAKYLIILQ